MFDPHPPTQHDPKLPLSERQASLPKLHPYLHDVEGKHIIFFPSKVSISISVETTASAPYTAAAENPSPSANLRNIPTPSSPNPTRAASRNGGAS